MTIHNEATALILRGLLNNDSNITALNGFRFATTRVTNHISALRKEGLQIETETIKTDSGKWYGRYKLVQTDRNIKLATELLEQIECKFSA